MALVPITKGYILIHLVAEFGFWFTGVKLKDNFESKINLKKFNLIMIT